MKCSREKCLNIEHLKGLCRKHYKEYENSANESEKVNKLPNRNELDSVINSSLANGKKPVRKEHTTDKPSENSLVDEIIERAMGEMASHKVSYKFQAIKEQGIENAITFGIHDLIKFPISESFRKFCEEVGRPCNHAAALGP